MGGNGGVYSTAYGYLANSDLLLRTTNLNGGTSGGDTAGGNLRTSSYTPNQLNQYTTVVTPGFKDVSGAAWATSTVTVNGGATDRKGEYWHRELGVSNGSSPVWQSVTATTGTTSSNCGRRA